MKRKDFIRISSLIPFIQIGDELDNFFNMKHTFQSTDKMPVFFIGHGNPLNTYKDNEVTRAWREMSAGLIEKPKSILVISAHYQSTNSTFLKVKPKFTYPDYPVDGAMNSVKMIEELGSSIYVDGATELDHGAWSVLRHIAPEKNIPVMELSLPMYQPYAYHHELAKRLAVLREKGVLIIGSGNVVHNLQKGALKSILCIKKPFHWATEFDEWVKDKINQRDFLSLVNYNSLGKIADLAVPTAEHYLPMLYCLDMSSENEEIHHTYEEVIGSTSMRCFRIG